MYHGSMFRFVKWYERSPLPIFLDMPPAQVTYDASLNTLDYLQPERTGKMERELYSAGRHDIVVPVPFDRLREQEHV